MSSKKDYIATAKAIKAALEAPGTGKDALNAKLRALTAVAEAMADYFAMNGGGRFDRSRFLAACGIEG